MAVTFHSELNTDNAVIPYASTHINPPLRPLLYGTTALFLCQLLLIQDFCYDMHFYGTTRGGGGGPDPLSTYLWQDAAPLLALLAIINVAYTWARGRFDRAYNAARRRRMFAGRLAFYQALFQLLFSLWLLAVPIFHE